MNRPKSAPITMKMPPTTPATKLVAVARARRCTIPPSDNADRNITKEKIPNSSKAQAPSDIGDQGLKARPPELSLIRKCQKRSGCPRSSVSKMGQIKRVGKLMRNAIREAAASRASPQRRSIEPST